jgi:hypothetical protein
MLVRLFPFYNSLTRVEAGATTMNAKHHLLRLDVRINASYARAAIIFNEKREIYDRLSELNFELRSLVQQDADAVTAARLDVPFRHPDKRSKRAHLPSK